MNYTKYYETIKSTIESEYACRISNIAVTYAYLHNDFDWYADDFLNAKHDKKTPNERIELAKQFMRGFVAEEFVNYYVNNRLAHEDPMHLHHVTFTNNDTRYSYSRYAKQNHEYTKADCLSVNGKSTEIKSGEYLIEPSAYAFDKALAEGAEYIIYVEFDDACELTERIFLTCFKYDGSRWLRLRECIGRDVTSYYKDFRKYIDTLIENTQ